MKDLILGGNVFVWLGIGFVAVAFIGVLLEKSISAKDSLLLYGPLVLSALLLYLFTAQRLSSPLVLVVAVGLQMYYYQRLARRAADRLRRRQSDGPL